MRNQVETGSVPNDSAASAPGQMRLVQCGDRLSKSSAGEILRLCLRGSWEPAALERARGLAAEDGVDWDAFRRTAADEFVLPLIFQAVRGAGIIPPSVEADFGRAYYATAARNSLLLNALQDILARLDAKRIRPMLLKGAALLATVYRNTAHRPMDDIDLMVRRRDLPTALDALTALGFVDQRTGRPARVAARYENEVELLRPAPPIEIVVDLHWNWVDSAYDPHSEIVDWLWEKARPAASGLPALVLCSEALVLHLCVHFLIDGGRRRLLRLYDIGQVVGQYHDEMNWDDVFRQARQFGLVLPLRDVLSQAVEEFAIPVPLAVREQLSRLSPSPAEERFFAWLIGSDRREYQIYSANLASRQGWLARARYVWHSLFPPPQYLMRLYRLRHAALLPLAYPYRWVKGLVRAVDMTIHLATDHVFNE